MPSPDQLERWTSGASDKVRSSDVSAQSIGVFGLGAIGSVISYHLGCNPVNQLYYFNRSERTKLRLLLPDGQQIEQQIQCQPARPDTPLDWLIICLKEHQVAEALGQIQLLISPTTRIAIIRNGLQHTAAFAELVAPECLLPVLIDCPTQPNSSGYYEQLRPAHLTVPANRLGEDFAQLLATTQLNLQLTEDFKTASWFKLIESAALGAITCLTGETCRIFQQPQVVAIFRTLVTEAIDVAKADGALVSDDYMELLVTKTQQYPAHKGSSMLSDRLAGKPIELGAKNGVIAQLGKKYAVATPTHDWVCALLSVVNAVEEATLDPRHSVH